MIFFFQAKDGIRGLVRSRWLGDVYKRQFQGNPFSKGILQFDFWGVEPKNYPWKELKESIVAHGTRNSLLTALMPTASTSYILGRALIHI